MKNEKYFCEAETCVFNKGKECLKNEEPHVNGYGECESYEENTKIDIKIREKYRK